MNGETQTPIQTQNPIIVAPPSTIPPPREEGAGEVKFHHHITPWVALVIIAAIAGTVGYLVWAKAHEAWPFDYDGPWSDVKRNPSTSLGTIGEYAGWKTYRNEEYGFEFEYASNLDVCPSSKTSEGSMNFGCEPRDATSWSFVSFNILESKLDEVMSDQSITYRNVKDFKKTNIEITGESAVQLTGTIPEDMGNMVIGGWYSVLMIPHGKDVIVIHTGVEDWLDHIISTFKFIEPTSNELQKAIQEDHQSWRLSCASSAPVDETFLPTLTYTRGATPFVQINFDWSRAAAFNIYRSATSDPNSWSKIISNLPSTAHTAVDYNIPPNANLFYYCIAGLDQDGKEIFRSLSEVVSDF